MDNAPRHGSRTVVALVLGLAALAGCGGPSDDDASPVPSTPTSEPARPLRPVSTPTGQSPAKTGFDLEKVVGGLDNPLYVTHAGDGSGRLFIVEQEGRVKVWKDGVLLPTPYLDIANLVASGGERGLLSIAFHPKYEENGWVIVDYTRRSTNPADNGDSVIARYKVSLLDANRIDPLSGEVLMVVDQPYANHNGGLVKFGTDGYLYIGFGDGGSGGDPHNNGQSLVTLLGKLLRIDVNAPGPYRIPSDNPFDPPLAEEEIWAYGLRNPWRFSFDRANGDLYIADVGQNAWEEIDHQPASSGGGENYGWNVYEGTHVHRPGVILEHTPPVAEYGHRGEVCSVTGGYVYRGPSVSALKGLYVLGDYCSGDLWTLQRQAGAWKLSTLRSTAFNVSSFGEDEDGELYLVDHGGSVYKFVAA